MAVHWDPLNTVNGGMKASAILNHSIESQQSLKMGLKTEKTTFLEQILTPVLTPI